MLKTLILSVIIACNCVASFGQPAHVKGSLDEYFAGVPLRQDFEKWIQYISAQPWLGIDSITDRGGYSSLKTDSSSHFPFSDSTKVKLLFQKMIYYDDVIKKPVDSTNEISIEGIFADNKKGKKESEDMSKELRHQLERNYRNQDTRYYPNGEETSFTNGKTEQFPNCRLIVAYASDLRFYFVMLTYTSPGKNPNRR
jgi:hypothetical protein